MSQNLLNHFRLFNKRDDLHLSAFNNSDVRIDLYGLTGKLLATTNRKVLMAGPDVVHIKGPVAGIVVWKLTIGNKNKRAVYCGKVIS